MTDDIGRGTPSSGNIDGDDKKADLPTVVVSESSVPKDDKALDDTRQIDDHKSPEGNLFLLIFDQFGNFY